MSVGFALLDDTCHFQYLRVGRCWHCVLSFLSTHITPSILELVGAGTGGHGAASNRSHMEIAVIWCVLTCRISDEELDSDPAANLLTSASEEAQKVARNEGKVRLTKACADSLRMLWLLWHAVLFAMATMHSKLQAAPLILCDYDDTNIPICNGMVLDTWFSSAASIVFYSCSCVHALEDVACLLVEALSVCM